MDSFSYQDYILPYSTLKTSSQLFGHRIPEFSLTIHMPPCLLLHTTLINVCILILLSFDVLKIVFGVCNVNESNIKNFP